MSTGAVESKGFVIIMEGQIKKIVLNALFVKKGNGQGIFFFFKEFYL